MTSPVTFHTLKHLALPLFLLLTICQTLDVNETDPSTLAAYLQTYLPENEELRPVSRSKAGCDGDHSKCMYTTTLFCTRPSSATHIIMSLIEPHWPNTGGVDRCFCFDDGVCRDPLFIIPKLVKCPACNTSTGLGCPVNDVCLSSGPGTRPFCYDCYLASLKAGELACMRPCVGSKPGKESCKGISCSESFYGSGISHDVAQKKGACLCVCCNGVR